MQVCKRSLTDLTPHFLLAKIWMKLVAIKCQLNPKTTTKVDKFKQKLDVDTQRDDDASPMSSYRCMLRPTWMLISALQHKSKYNFKLFWEKNQIFGFPCCSTREDLSIDVSITNVGLILTKLWRFLFSGYGQTDAVLESSHGNMSAHKKLKFKFSTQSSKLVVSCRLLMTSTWKWPVKNAETSTCALSSLCKKGSKQITDEWLNQSKDICIIYI